MSVARVVQADAGQDLTGTPEPVGESLGTVSATGRRALTELRHLLGALDPGGDSTPIHDRAPLQARCATSLTRPKPRGSR